ncbi:MAG: helix-turn-helix domain-containing protein, partial [Nocardioidaceae bacterium]|nr:helix-turn-helix domain-containing protein [Nocardioidaceae bacterium]
LLLSEAGQEHVQTFVDRRLGPVQRYDAIRGTALLETLEVFFASEANVAAAAERLFIHVNTMYQRLDRLEKLLGDGWRTGDRALELRLAIRLQQLLAGSVRKSISPPTTQ